MTRPRIGGLAGYLQQHSRQRVLLEDVANQRAVRVTNLIRDHAPKRDRRGLWRYEWRYEDYLTQLQRSGLIWIHHNEAGQRVASVTLRGRNALARLRAFERGSPT